MEIKDILYRILNDEGIDDIRMLLNNDIQNSKDLIRQIFTKLEALCSDKKFIPNHLVLDDHLKSESPHYSDQLYREILIGSSKALLHFLLASSVIPSERNVLFKNIELDVVIPNLKVLKTYPMKSIVIQFDNENVAEMESRIDNLKNEFSLEWSLKNLWIISYNRDFSKCKSYALKNKIKSKKGETENKSEIKNYLEFKNILIDINNFLKNTNDKSIKILPI